MKKTTLFAFLMILGVAFAGFSQTAPADAYAGKWAITFIGTPNGDSKLVTELVRKDGKLTGELKDPSGQMPEALPLTNVEEKDGKLILYFTAQGMDINVWFQKVDDDNLKGSLLDMFDATAVRIKE